MCGEYHDGSLQECMEAQYGSPENAPDGIPARDVDAALRRIEHILLVANCPRWLQNIITNIIREERERLGLPAETEVRA